ncbi:hypothetical protein [Sphingomonas cavernae]|uniref:Uncharacterized protein n=1 Tax=Sphingomonas cavernae TaxID=2320861 RepID=A0A418WP39_9SPHN|nr:hypothetical protein D3876_01030 [Sphingomonas cavernae]
MNQPTPSTSTNSSTPPNQHNFPEALVYTILRGQRRCKRGLSHRIAVALGIKDSDAVARAELRGGDND